MCGDHSGASGLGLARSCEGSDWLRHTTPVGGVEWLTAWFGGAAYRTHRHDTYAIGLTETGVQAFTYRGARWISLPGDVVVLHPDELHDGYAGSEAGFGYRQLYIEPALIFEATRRRSGGRGTLPFVRQPVVRSPLLASAVRAAFRDDREPLAIDDLVVRLTEGLLAAAPDNGARSLPHRLDLAAIGRAREFLDGERTRVVRSAELEAVTGLSRYELARQFRQVMGTSPYRYSLLRRLEAARGLIEQRRSLVDVALAAGFADQAHLTRHFAATYGFTPARYAVLRATAPA